MAIKINENYLLLKSSYLFAEVANRLAKFESENPEKKVISMGIGDVTKPLPKSVIKAFKDAVDEMGNPDTFMGYGPEHGYEFLREAIIKGDFEPLGVELDIDEIFISDGAKCDTGNFQELFSTSSKIAVTDPVYTVYVDTNVMAGRTGPMKDDGMYEGLVYLPCTAENDFEPEIPDEDIDIIYLCYPNNPTGSTLTKDQLEKFVKYARENNVLILFDAAYEKFIREDNIPHSIYEIEGAKEVAVEFRSFSKTAGFTGTRCAYCIVPKELTITDSNGDKQSLNALWDRRQTTKFNGVSYPVQKAAEAIYSPEGQKEVQENIDYYLKNAKLIRDSLTDLGLTVSGGINSPYIWMKCIDDMSSWEFFDYLLEKFQISQ